MAPGQGWDNSEEPVPMQLAGNGQMQKPLEPLGVQGCATGI